MKPSEYSESFKAFEKAAEAIEAAQHDIKGNYTLAAVNRLYYTCYYCMTALLLTKNAYAKTHQGARSKFSELFIKTNILPDYIANNIKDAFELRQEADYDLDADITADEARNLLKKTTEFFKLTEAYLQKFIADS